MEIFGVPFPFLKTRYLLGGPEIGRVFVSALGGFTTARKEEESWTDEVFFVFQEMGTPYAPNVRNIYLHEWLKFMV